MRRVALSLTVLALLGAVVGPVNAAGSGGQYARGLYIVRMADLPAVAYDGSIKGYKATRPAPGSKIDPFAPDVTKYVGYLKNQHDNALQRAGGGNKLYDYSFSYNGFLARLSAGQAAALAKDPQVLSLSPNETVTADTSSTYEFLGLNAPGGLWDQLGGVTTAGKNKAGAGDGIIIGDIDSGIWPESLSFSDRDANGKLVYQQIPGWHGKCTPGEQWVGSTCNQKLIGAQWFNAGQGGDAQTKADRPWEFMSARDYNGHGTHTASTAGGNFGVAATGATAVFGSITGMAPRARIAVYKALWSTEDASTASGTTGDLVAAIDQAVADGVDVINYSISGTTTNFADPVEISFLFAASAGIFVSESAGNSGPTTGTVAHPSPWTTTVAAGTHNRNGMGSVTLGNGATYNGASVATAVGPAPLIDSTAAGLSGADATELALCYGASDGDVVLDPAKVAGKIVVCDRGVTGRTNKSLAVQEAGGVGMILVNTSANSLNADFHFVPTVHLADTDRAAIKAYAATAGATATINQATIVYNAPAPFTASFSSRGPLTAGGGDLLKPDVIAPGQDILAAVAPPGNHGFDFNLYSGTSMSAPHVTGVAALLKQLHPNWSPMAIKSALMTSAYDVLDGPNTNPLVIFRQGAGHIKPNSAADPGLVYDSGWNDWLAFLCGTTTAVGAATCSALTGLGYSTDPSDFNAASIAIGDLAGQQTVTRTVRNVGLTAATYTASTTGLTGVSVVVNPSSFTLNPGQTKTFDVTFTRTSATLNSYVGGQLTWSDGSHNVRSPMVIRPVAIAAPALKTVTASADSGNVSWTVKLGYAGTLSANAFGAAPDLVTLGEVVVQDADQDPETDPFDATKGVNTYDFSLNSGTTQYWAGGTMAATTEAGSDLDVYLLREMANGTAGFQFPADLVAQSADGDSEEIVQLVHPVTGNYRLMVHGWGTPDGASTYDLHRWDVGGTADAGSLTALAGSGDPFAVATGDVVNITANWSSLTSVGTQYRGVVDYLNTSSTRIGSTLMITNR
jgi:subtilisin family serine protease